MPSPRKTNGILKLEYSSNNSDWTEITSLEANNSEIRFLENNAEAQTSYGGSYSYPEMREYDCQFLNRTIYDTIKAFHTSDTNTYFRWTLDTDELRATNIGVIPGQLIPITVTGKEDGRGDRYRLMISVPQDKITETIS